MNGNLPCQEPFKKGVPISLQHRGNAISTISQESAVRGLPHYSALKNRLGVSRARPPLPLGALRWG